MFEIVRSTCTEHHHHHTGWVKFLQARGIHDNYINISRTTHPHTHTNTHAAAEVIQTKRLHTMVF
jgi:hypothetical protein